MPNVDTIVSQQHKILFNNEMIRAVDLLKINKNVIKYNYNGEILYNVLIDDSNENSNMIINNLEVETLNADCLIAKLYLQLQNTKCKKEYKEFINEYKKKINQASVVY